MYDNRQTCKHFSETSLFTTIMVCICSCRLSLPYSATAILKTISNQGPHFWNVDVYTSSLSVQLTHSIVMPVVAVTSPSTHTYLKPSFTYVNGEFFAGNLFDKSPDISFTDLDHVTLCTSLNCNCCMAIVESNTSRLFGYPPMNPATLLQAFANLLSTGSIKYRITGSVRVRVSINIKLLVLHFIHLYSQDSATGCRDRIHDVNSFNL